MIKGRFIKGRSSDDEPIETRLKRISSLKESWKKRKDYIGDIRSIHPYIYNSWRGLMFTSKGKAQGISEEWKDFRKFFNDVNKAYEKGKVLRRKDTSKPFSVNNFMWVTKEEYNLSYIHKNSVRLFYEGELLTLKEISIKYNVGYSAL